MFRVSVTSSAENLTAIIRCLRTHTDLPFGEIRARLHDGRPVAEFPFDGDTVAEVRRCRAFLRDLETAGAGVRIYETVEGYPEKEESVDLLRNVMHSMISTARQLRGKDDACAGD